MAGLDLGFDGRDFPAAALDSRRYLPLADEFLERPAVAVEPGLLPA
jgi:hypothetical protein